MGITFTSKGDFTQTERYLQRAAKLDLRGILNKAGNLGVKALAAHTPRDSGLAADSWGYKITGSRYFYTIVWTNSDVEAGFPVAIMIQYGHGTGTGGYVQGVDYINPAMQPIFDQIAEQAWKEVNSL